MATAFYIASSFKAFALTGRQVCEHDNPGSCPGLRAFATSGRIADGDTPMALPFQGVLGRITLLLPFSIEVFLVAEPRLACVLLLVIT